MFTNTKLFILASLVAGATLIGGSAEPDPKGEVSALIAEQAEALGALYERDATSEQIRTVIMQFDAEAAPLMAQLDDAERAAVVLEIEALIAEHLWKMAR